MPRATASPTAGVSPLQSSTPSADDAPPVQQPSVDNDIPVTLPQLPAPVRKPPTALNLSQSRRVRRKKSVMSMPRVLPSPTVPLLHRIPGSINFPRLAGSPTPPSFSSSSSSESDDEDEDDVRSSPASRRSFPDDWEAAARHRLLGRRDSDHHGGGGGAARRRRTFDHRATADAETDDWRWNQVDGDVGNSIGKRRLPYVDSLPRDAATRSLLSMSTSRPAPLARSKSMPNSDSDDDEVWC